MATTINDAFTAIDDYMAKNGKGQNYLAKKFIDLFEDKDSPLNMHDGPLKKLSEKFLLLSDAAETMELTMRSFNTKLRVTMGAIKLTHFSELEQASIDLTDRIKLYTKAIGSTPLPGTLPSNSTNLNLSKKISEIITRINTNIGVIRLNTVFMRDLMVQASKEKSGGHEYFKEKSSGGGEYKNLYYKELYIIQREARLEKEKEKKGGFMSWLITAAKITGGIYLLGKLKQFFDDSPFGKAIKSTLKLAFINIAKGIGEFLSSPSTWKTMLDAVKLGGSIIKFVSKNIWNYIIKPLLEEIKAIDWKENIKWLKENAVKYIIDPMLKFINETNWGGVVENIGNKFVWIWENVLTPIFTSIKDSIMKDVESGNFKSAAVKILGTGLLIGAFSKIIPGFSLLTKVVMGVVGGLSKLLVAGGPWMIIAAEMAIISAGIYSMYESIISIRKTQEKVDKSKKETQDVGQSIKDDFDKEHSVRIVELKDKQLKDVLTMKEARELKYLSLLEANIDNQKRAADINASGKNSADINRMLKVIESNIDANNVILNEMDRTDELVKKMRSESSTKIEDGEIVIPDKKDSHIFAKGGGPFDKSLKEMNMKLQMVIELLGDGFGTLISTTSDSGEAVASAVIASAGSSRQSSSTPVYGGSNPIRQHRINTGRHIEFGE